MASARVELFREVLETSRRVDEELIERRKRMKQIKEIATEALTTRGSRIGLAKKILSLLP